MLGYLDQIWELTQGQPWLVNALAYEVTFQMKANRDRSIPIRPEMIYEAKENLILRRETHLDQLVHKLQEPRMRRVIEPMLEGTDAAEEATDDDIKYVIDLGLARRNKQVLEIANPIYREVIPRELTNVIQIDFATRFQSAWYIAEDGSLDMHKLLTDFQAFFRENSEHWVERFQYKEAGPQLLMQAYLQRIINGGGQIRREYGLGRRRTDLQIIWPYGDGQVQSSVIELKIRYGALETTIQEGLKQTWYYMDRAETDDAHLIIFDRRPTVPSSEKVFTRIEQHQGKSIQIWGM